VAPCNLVAAVPAAMERVTGTVFIGFGVRLATLSHR
jgi:hypothetical protein